MIILILTPNFPLSTDLSNHNPFGGEIVYGEAIALRKSGADVIVLAPHLPGSLSYEEDEYGIRIYRFRYFFPTKFQRIRLPNRPIYSTEKLLLRLIQLPFFFISMYFSLLRIIRSVDIIYANWTQTAFLTLPFKWLFKKPIFLTFRGTDLKIFPFRINRFIIENVDGVLSWPLGDVVKMQKYTKGNYFRLPIISRIKDNSNKRQLDPKNIRFLFLGRLVSSYAGEVKGVPLLISAVRLLLKKHNNFHMDIVGDGPYKRTLSNECSRYNLDDYIIFHGHQEMVTPFLMKSDAVIGGAGLNAVAQESALSSCLLILPNLIEWIGNIWYDKQNSLVYEIMNAVSLADVMAYVIENREKCKQIAEEGHNTIKKYVKDVDNAGRYYLSAFKQLIENKKK